MTLSWLLSPSLRCIQSSGRVLLGASRQHDPCCEITKHTSARSIFSQRRHISSSKPLTVLAIESSCDDSCCAIVTSDRKILANVVIKQHLQNAKYGGVHPIKAQDAHSSGVPLAIRQALHQTHLNLSDLDAIAYTRGPGMYGCLSIGASSAKALASVSRKPLIGIHHMQAHALLPLLTEESPPSFPFLVLLVSGGHTQLVLCETLGNYKILMNKLDNSVGDAFDKIARLLQLPPHSNLSPGSVLESYAAKADPQTSSTITLPMPFKSLKPHDPLAFSFAGLLTGTNRYLEKNLPPNSTKVSGGIPLHIQRNLAWSFQNAAVEHIIMQVLRAIERLPKDMRERLGGLVVSGGVAGNQVLRSRLEGAMQVVSADRETGLKLYYPPVELCTDNAAMIAWTAILRLQAGGIPPEGESFDLPIRAKWSLEDLYNDNG